MVVKKSLDYLSDLNESSYSDLSDPDLSETELEFIEMENRMKESMSKEELARMSRSNSLSHAGSGSLLSSPVRSLATKRISCDNVGSWSGSEIDGRLAKVQNGKSKNGFLDPAQICDSLSKAAPFRFEIELRPIENRPNVAINNRGWMWISGVQGRGASAADGMQNAIDNLVQIINQNGYELNHLCYMSLYVRNMNDYAELNAIYAKTLNFANPPARVCVECPLPAGLQVIMEAVAFRPRNNDVQNQRHTMHVQSISHWAPANIGPYSQSTRVGEITYIAGEWNGFFAHCYFCVTRISIIISINFAGQIALVPGSMTLIEGGIRPQCKLALRHLTRIAKVITSRDGQLRDVVQGICFVTHPNYITEARRQLERRTTNAIMDYIVVPALPRKALVEWQVWVHSHNDKFDCELFSYY